MSIFTHISSWWSFPLHFCSYSSQWCILLLHSLVVNGHISTTLTLANLYFLSIVYFRMPISRCMPIRLSSTDCYWKGRGEWQWWGWFTFVPIVLPLKPTCCVLSRQILLWWTQGFMLSGKCNWDKLWVHCIGCVLPISIHLQSIGRQLVWKRWFLNILPHGY